MGRHGPPAVKIFAGFLRCLLRRFALGATGLRFFGSSSNRRSVTDKMRVCALLGPWGSGDSVRWQMITGQGRDWHDRALGLRLSRRAFGRQPQGSPPLRGNCRGANSCVRSLGTMRRDVRVRSLGPARRDLFRPFNTSRGRRSAVGEVGDSANGLGTSSSIFHGHDAPSLAIENRPCPIIGVAIPTIALGPDRPAIVVWVLAHAATACQDQTARDASGNFPAFIAGFLPLLVGTERSPTLANNNLLLTIFGRKVCLIHTFFPKGIGRTEASANEKAPGIASEGLC